MTWTQRASPVPSDLNEVTYGNGVFVIVGDQSGTPNGKILTSTDGVNWDDRTDASTGVNARGIAFANGLFVVALNDGNILYGPDPISIAWSYAVTGVSKNGANLRGLTWSNGLWVATGNNGLLLTSTNAQVWKQRLTPTDQNLHAVRFFNGTFIAIGNAGTILQTGPLVPQLFAGRSEGNLQLTFSSPDEGVFKLQETDDFIWHDLATITNAVGTVDYTVPLPPGTTRKFFRVIVP